MTDVLTLRWDTGFAQHTYELVGAAGADDVIGCWVMDITATQDEFNAVMMTISQAAYSYLRRDDQ
jgi:hypothetical protein